MEWSYGALSVGMVLKALRLKAEFIHHFYPHAARTEKKGKILTSGEYEGVTALQSCHLPMCRVMLKSSFLKQQALVRRGWKALGSFPEETDIPKKAEGMRGWWQQGEKRQSKMGRKAKQNKTITQKAEKEERISKGQKVALEENPAQAIKAAS